MAVLAIKKVGEPGEEVLRRRARKVERVDAAVQKLLEDMVETMYAARGIGLAAPQVGISRRLIVVDVGEGPLKLINPRLVAVGEERAVATEGCLSIPGVVGDVERPWAVTVRGLDEQGRPVRVEAEDLLARVLQHEIDHLEGRLFTDLAIHLREPEAEDSRDRDEAVGVPRA